VTGSTRGPTNSPTSWATLDYLQDAADATPTNVAFSSQTVDTTSAAQTITLKNTSTEDLQILRIEVAGPFYETNNCCSEIVGGGSCTIAVRFTPTSEEPNPVRFLFTTSGPAPPDVVTLSGTGLSGTGGNRPHVSHIGRIAFDSASSDPASRVVVRASA
jgi:hypothetical protein